MTDGGSTVTSARLLLKNGQISKTLAHVDRRVIEFSFKISTHRGTHVYEERQRLQYNENSMLKGFSRM